MATIHYDILKGARGEYSVEGYRLERVVIVEGVTGQAYEKLPNAVQELVNDGIYIGKVHPADSSAHLRSIVPESITGQKVRLRLAYSQPHSQYEQPRSGQTLIRYDARVSQERTHYDKDGNLLEVTFTYPNQSDLENYYPDCDDPSAYAGKTIKQTSEASKFVPQFNAQYTRTLAYDPAFLARDYVGTVNIMAWKNHTAGTLLCTGITANSNDDGLTYRTSFYFQYRPDTWVSTIMFRLPWSGKPPKAAELANNADAVKTKKMHSLMDFHGLPL